KEALRRWKELLEHGTGRAGRFGEIGAPLSEGGRERGDRKLVGSVEHSADRFSHYGLDRVECRRGLLVLIDGGEQMNAARIRDEVWDRDDLALVEDLGGPRSVGNVRRRGDDRAADSPRKVGGDGVRPRAGHEHVALEREQLLARPSRVRAVDDEVIAVLHTE